MDAELAGPGAEQVALGAGEVAQIQQLKEAVILFGDGVFFYINLKLRAALLQVREARLAHAADGLNAAGNANGDRGLELLGRLGRVFGYDFGNGMGELEPLAVGFKAKSFDFMDAAQALLKQVIFEGQGDLLGE